MKICANCFKDTDLRMRILSLKNLKKYDIHNRREYIFDTDDDTVSIKVDMGRLVNLYDTTSSIDNSSLTGKTLIDRIQNDWQIFSTNINENQIRTVLVELLKDSFDKDDPIYKSPLVIPDLYNNQFKEDYSIIKNKDWNSFKENILHGNRFFNSDLDKELLTNIMKYSVEELQKNSLLFRARIVDSFDDIREEKDMLIPPKKILDSRDGRMNPRGIGMLYLASKKNIAIREVRSSFNDKVVIAPIEIVKNIKVVDLTRIAKLSPFNMLDTIYPKVYQLNKETINTIVEELETPIRTNHKSLDYLPTQYLSAIAQLNFEGIKYSSTMVDRDPNNFNVVLFDKQIESKVKVRKNDREELKIKMVRYNTYPELVN